VARIYTIGHSTRTLADFTELLRSNRIERLADIRRYPGSRRHPHFSREALAESLPRDGIAYIHMPELGGRRKPAPDSPNAAWRNDQFRAYADYMATKEFAEAIERLLAFSETTAIMCAEAVPWRCHRNLVSDDLVRREVEVLHIIDATDPRPHELNPMARVEGDHLIYPAEGQRVLFPAV
jgi:uncharacterized protein (DUF488 family)